ncbi:MAG: SIS domain-containing protein [Caulobacteraceae bacterium]|nr:SIS domain-containing protein [Caulobacteraceae bacterium]
MNNVKKYIDKHIEEITKIFSFDIKNLTEFTNTILNCKNKIFFTGIGKNGHVASKAASTFNSIGTQIFFINPVDAVHGDMGLIEDNDVIVIISKSGNTEELICFLENVINRTQNIWLIHSNQNNKSLKYCYKDIFIPIEREADYLELVPTISIAAYTILLQSIACSITEINHLTLSKFQSNHPGGSLGKIK